jgi:uncharacterized membrane protein
MPNTDNMVVYAGLYGDVDDAVADFAAIKAAHGEKWIGFYEAAVFEKNADGKVKVLDTDATVRGTGAKLGIIAGAIVGVIFPPSVLASAIVGAGVGAGVGNFAKGFTKGDIKRIADDLEPGQAGVILIGEITLEEGAERLMKKAKKLAKQIVDADAAALKEEIDAM